MVRQIPNYHLKGSCLLTRTDLCFARSGVSARGTLRRGPEILLHPCEEARRAVDEEARPGEGVIFPRIHDELRRNAERSQGLIHLLTAGDGHVEILVAAEEQRRCVNVVRMEERIGDLQP